MANNYSTLQTYSINDSAELSVERDAVDRYHVVIRSDSANQYMSLLTSTNQGEAEHFFKLVKEAYETLIY